MRCTWAQTNLHPHGRGEARGDGRTIDQRRADAFTDIVTTLLDTDTGPYGRPLPRRHGTRATVHVTVAASTLLGLDDLPAELTGYGPIPADLARQIAQDATWTRILTDPATGIALEHGTVRYRPGADLTRTVIARDVTCTFPGCRMPAIRCDLDHITPYDPTRPAATQTVEHNLHALCRRHHNAKTHTRWTVTRNPTTATTTWTTPAGLTHTRPPTPAIHTPTATHRTGRATTRAASPLNERPPRPRPAGDGIDQPARAPSPDDDPPPF